MWQPDPGVSGRSPTAGAWALAGKLEAVWRSCAEGRGSETAAVSAFEASGWSGGIFLPFHAPSRAARSCAECCLARSAQAWCILAALPSFASPCRV